MGAVGHAASCCPVSVYVQQFFETQTWVSDANRKRNGMRYVGRAMSAGLVSMFSLIDITLVVYDFYSFAMVPIIGTTAIVSIFIIYALIAYFREDHGPEAREKK